MDSDDKIAEVERVRAELLDFGRTAMGVTGSTETRPFKEVIGTSGVGWYPLLALSVVVVVDEFQRTVFGVLAPEITRALGIGRTTLGAMVSLSLLAVTLAALPMAALVQRHPRRAAVTIGTALVWSVATLFTGFVTGPLPLVALLMLDGATTGSVNAVHPALLFDLYPPEARVRVLSFYRGADAVGRVLAPLLVAVLTGLFFLTWRGVFLVMGLLSIAAALFAVRLRDPGFGKWDVSMIKRAVDEGEVVDEEDEVTLGFFETVRRLLLIPTIRRLYVGYALLGMMFVPLITFTAFFLEDKFELGASGRGIFSATTPVLAIATLMVTGRRSESLFRRDPADLMRFSAIGFAAAIGALVLGVLSPWLLGAWLGFGAMQAIFAALTPALSAALQGVIPARSRPHASALGGIFLLGVGGLGGLALLGGIDRRFGIEGAILVLVIPAAIAMIVLYRTGELINPDLDRTVELIIEEQELKNLRRSGASLPLLACRNIDFAYDRLQVLFDCSFTVDDGEMVALLGTNGAGKSTLLRVISGLGLPSRGTVRLNGADITYVEPRRRVELGISQIPGGRGIFPRLTVVENLRAYGHSLARDKRALEAGIDTTFERFPRLAERRDQLASTLSGGEAQMLALGKVFLLRPRLLLIDELSLGLAPRVVAELLAMVREINATGTAVVLVEQSVNIALNLADHAYFMEKGEVRFDGRASDLLERGDLLRSVFLEGAVRGVGR